MDVAVNHLVGFQEGSWFVAVDAFCFEYGKEIFRHCVSAFRQLSRAKQTTTRYAGGKKGYTKNSPISYNKGVQAYCKRKVS